MPQNTGTLIGATIRPNDSTDKYAVAFAEELKGGYVLATTRSALYTWATTYPARCEVNQTVAFITSENLELRLTNHSNRGNAGGWTDSIDFFSSSVIKGASFQFKAITGIIPTTGTTVISAGNSFNTVDPADAGITINRVTSDGTNFLFLANIHATNSLFFANTSYTKTPDGDTFELKPNCCMLLVGDDTTRYITGGGGGSLDGSEVLALVLNGLGAGSNTPITSSNTLIEAFANLQAQVTARLAGTLASDAETQITGSVSEDNKFVSRLKLFNWWVWIKTQVQDIAGIWTFSDATDSTSTTTGGLKVSGGLGVAKTLFAKAVKVSDLLGGTTRHLTVNTNGELVATADVKEHTDIIGAVGGNQFENILPYAVLVSGAISSISSVDSAVVNIRVSGSINGTYSTPSYPYNVSANSVIYIKFDYASSTALAGSIKVLIKDN